jgi:hypothetical protein
LVGIVAALTAACGTEGLHFTDSTAVHDIEPRSLQRTSTPITLSWRARSLPPGHKYLVLVDQAPMQPGQSLKDLVDDSCKAIKGCPDKTYLETHYIYETAKNRVKIVSVPVAGSYDTQDLSDLHHVAIVVLDDADRRVGEQIWTTDIRVPT